MHKARGLTIKYAVIFSVFILSVSAFAITGFYFTSHIRDEATRINLAGQLRYRTFEIGWLIQKFAEREYGQTGILTQQALRRDLMEKEEVFSRSITLLRAGDPEMGLGSLSHEDALDRFRSLAAEWEGSIRPVIRRVIDLPDTAGEEEIREEIELYDLRITGYVQEIDRMVSVLEGHYREEIGNADRLRIYMVLFFIAGAVSMVLYARRGIIAPVRRLTVAAEKLRKGDFEASLEVTGRDEIGLLAETFRSMSTTLRALFKEKTEHLQELQVLHEISKAAGRSLALEETAGRVLDAMLDLESLKLDRKAAVFLCDEGKRSLTMISSRNFLPEQLGGCGTVGFGECLCGLCAEKAELIISDSSTADERHAKRYADHKDHGHIILPLLSRDSVIGVLCLYLQPGISLTEAETGLYQSIADILAVTMQNALNHRQVALLAQILESTSDFVGTASPDGRAIYMNRAGRQMLRIGGHEDISFMQISEFHPVWAGEIIIGQGIPAAVRDGVWSGETALLSRDGREIPVSQVILVHRDPGGDPAFLSTIARDISELKSAEGEIRKGREQLQAIIDNATAVIYLKDLQGRYLLVNRRWSDLFHISKDEAVGKTDRDVFPQEMAAKFRENDRKVIDAGTPVEFEETALHDDGLHTYLSNKFPMFDASGQPYGVCGISTDITERKKTEDLLRKSGEDLRNAQRIARVGSWIWNIPRNVLVWSEEVYRIFGLKRIEFDGTHEAFLHLIHPDDCRMVADAVDTALHRGQAYDIDHRILFSDGSVRFVHEQAEVTFDAKGRPVMMSGTVQDITERKLADERLREYSQQLLALNLASNAILGITTSAELYRTVCENALRLFSISMVWIGMIEKGDHRLRPVASAGMEEGYVSSITVTWDDTPTGMGPAGLSIKQKEPVQMRIEDLPVEQWRKEGRKRGYRTVLGIPLITGSGNCIGSMVFYRETPELFSQEALQLCQVFANQAAVVIENARIVEGLEDRIRERTRELEDANTELLKLNEEFESVNTELGKFSFRLHKLYELSYTRTSGAYEFARIILTEIVGMLGVEAADISFAEAGGFRTYVVVTEKYADLDIREGMFFPSGDTFLDRVKESGRPVVVPDALLSEELRSNVCVLKYGIRSFLGVPIEVNGRFFGVLASFGKSPFKYAGNEVTLHQLLSKRLEFEFAREKYEADLKEATERAEAASRAKSDFLANMSHELRTPLNSIIGFSEVLLGGMAGPVAEEQKDFLGDILGSGRHLLSLINDILDLSKVEAGKMELDLSEFRVKALLGDSLGMFREKAMKHGIRVGSEVGEEVGTVVADERKIKQVLFNLLSNAIKFTPDGGSVRVSVRTITEDGKIRRYEDREMVPTSQSPDSPVFGGNFIEISVEDTGIGISAEDRERLFQPFQQVDSTLTKKHEGTGLGLSLCRKFVELHGGRIWVESEPGRGSRFIFILPERAEGKEHTQGDGI